MNIKDYFSFTRGERRGSLVLICILLIVFFIRYLDYPWRNEEVPFDPTQFEQEVADFLAQSELSSKNINQSTDSLFQFNPNNISDQQWEKLGFKKWQISSINKYKAKGGRWKTKESFSRLYGLTKERYNKLEPYILLPATTASNKKKPTLFVFNPNTATVAEFKKLGLKDWQIENIEKFKANGGQWKSKDEFKQLYGLKKESFERLKPFIDLPDSVSTKATEALNVEINSANEAELLKLNGIHSIKYAKIIIKYRDQLGGFSSKKQLLETWGMKSETLQKFEHQIYINRQHIHKLNINQLSASQLVKHPYIDWKVANGIEKYRKQHGKFGEIEELRSLHLINEKLYQKLAPYLKLTE